ncbi:hypothetical protein B0H13DRAFT_1540512, partial [Mycena leptocephala]
HDAAESYPQPRCHPETRKKLLDELWTWCGDSSTSNYVSDDSSHHFRDCSVDSPIVWLHGPAGAGKSAVMKSLSERLETAHQLGGTFFFKRGHPTR